MRLPRSRYLALAAGVISLAWCASVGATFQEQVGYVDLTQTHGSANLAGDGEKQDLPDGCKELKGGVIADGWKETEDGRPRNIKVAVIRVGTSVPTIRGELLADLRLQNAGTVAIQIPWTTDPNEIKIGQGPDYFEWESGSFSLILSHTILINLGGGLFGSQFVGRSMLTIPPGGTVTASVRFKLEEYGSHQQVDSGDWKLSAEWSQTWQTWTEVHCAVNRFYVHYDHYYQEETPAVALHVFESAAKSSGGH